MYVSKLSGLKIHLHANHINNFSDGDNAGIRCRHLSLCFECFSLDALSETLAVLNTTPYDFSDSFPRHLLSQFDFPEVMSNHSPS